MRQNINSTQEICYMFKHVYGDECSWHLFNHKFTLNHTTKFAAYFGKFNLLSLFIMGQKIILTKYVLHTLMWFVLMNVYCNCMWWKSEFSFINRCIHYRTSIHKRFQYLWATVHINIIPISPKWYNKQIHVQCVLIKFNS